MRLISKTFSCLLLAAFFTACQSGETKTAQDNYQMTKEELKKQEQQSPVSFLEVAGKNKKNLVGQTVIRGKIHNKATLATFKDVEVKLSFYSKTKALLETDKETIFEELSPGVTRDFKTKYFAPKGTDSVAMEVLAATVVQ